MKAFVARVCVVKFFGGAAWIKMIWVSEFHNWVPRFSELTLELMHHLPFIFHKHIKSLCLAFHNMTKKKNILKHFFKSHQIYPLIESTTLVYLSSSVKAELLMFTLQYILQQFPFGTIVLKSRLTSWNMVVKVAKSVHEETCNYSSALCITEGKFIGVTELPKWKLFAAKILFISCSRQDSCLKSLKFP